MSDVGNLHRSHDRPRLEPARDIKAVPPPSARRPPRRQARPYRSSRHSLLAQVRAAAEAEVGTGESRDLARLALKLYRAGKRELQADSPTAPWACRLEQGADHPEGQGQRAAPEITDEIKRRDRTTAAFTDCM